ncbi:MAG: hypothetical protein IIA33_08845 [Planctomycetes bacterium]|nr:hypothetical protein [Planctomycetota bacterium]
MNTLKCLALVPALMIIAAAGCIKRSETITIFEDGRLRLTAEIVGDPDDVYNGDAMPTAESGWQIEDRIETDSEGKKELTRTATREIAAGAEIPDSYAPPNSRLDLTALQSLALWRNSLTALPDRLYLIGVDGTIAYKSGQGPMGFRPEELDAAITSTPW